MKPKLYIFLLFVLLTSCSSGVTSPTPNSNTPLAYPVAGETPKPTSVGQGYPLPSDNSTVIRVPVGSLPIAPSSASEPQPGKASISGILFDFSNSMVLPLSVFYLTPATGPEKKDPPPLFLGPHPERGDISAFSDKNGYISLVNIPPGNYFMAVPGAMDWRVIQKTKNDQTPLFIELKAGQKLALGVIFIP